VTDGQITLAASREPRYLAASASAAIKTTAAAAAAARVVSRQRDLRWITAYDVCRTNGPRRHFNRHNCNCLRV